MFVILPFAARLRAAAPSVCLSAAVALTVALPFTVQAQTARDTLHACYVPGSGTMYRVGATGAPATCTRPDHIAFRFGAAETPMMAAAQGGDHGSLSGLSDDDHPQYLLANGVRQSAAGFAVTGAIASGAGPVSGAGVRMMWHARKAAFRAGRAIGTEWDDASIGTESAAFGEGTRARGYASFAAGALSRAEGSYSTALGYSTQASGELATALGRGGVASGYVGLATGYNTTASGELSTAMGTRANTNFKSGSFVYGDAYGQSTVSASADNQFVVKAQRIWLGSTTNVTATAGRYIETSTGAHLSAGGAWVSSSDSSKKHRWEEVDGETMLAKLTAMPIRTWSYREEPDSVRHLGPTAQDFRSAFGLGDSDKAIASVDGDGVALAAAKALEQRTTLLLDEVASLRAELASLRAELATERERNATESQRTTRERRR